MRMLALVPLLLVAACSEQADADQKGAAAAKKAMQFSAGQWETTAQYTAVKVTEGTTPGIEAAVNTPLAGAGCVGEAEAKKPKPALFAAEGDSCSYQNFYMSRGRLTADMRCSREGVPGEIMVSLQGSYTADSFELASDTRTILAGPGDIEAAGTITGRRTGPTCTPTTADA